MFHRNFKKLTFKNVFKMVLHWYSSFLWYDVGVKRYFRKILRLLLNTVNDFLMWKILKFEFVRCCDELLIRNDQNLKEGADILGKKCAPQGISARQNSEIQLSWKFPLLAVTKLKTFVELTKKQDYLKNTLGIFHQNKRIWLANFLQIFDKLSFFKNLAYKLI